MTKLSAEARSILSEGLAADGPSPERRRLVKARLLAAMGTGTLALGSATSAAGAAAPALAGGTAAIAKGLGAGTLLLWFGTGAAIGVGASGAAALIAQRAPEVAASARPGRVSAAPRRQAPAPTLVPHPELPSHPTAPEPNAAVALDAPPANATPGDARSPLVRVPEPAEPETSPSAPSPRASASTLSEEATLLQRAQSALAAKNPELALAVLAEHERRFAAGALAEERRAAKVLALCALGRVDEARALARAFVNAAPRSVLVPRLEHSCAAPL